MANLYSRVSLDEVVKSLNRRFRKITGRNAAPLVTELEDSNPTPSTLESAAPAPIGWPLALYRLRHWGAAPPGSAQQKHPRKSRVNYSLAASAMLPAIFVQVPSGLSVSGSLVQGIVTSDQIVGNKTGTTLTQGDVYSQDYGGKTNSSIAFTVGFSVVQVAIGITVGLFLGSLVIYPFGKTGGKKRQSTRGGLFSY